MSGGKERILNVCSSPIMDFITFPSSIHLIFHTKSNLIYLLFTISLANIFSNHEITKEFSETCRQILANSFLFVYLAKYWKIKYLNACYIKIYCYNFIIVTHLCKKKQD